MTLSPRAESWSGGVVVQGVSNEPVSHEIPCYAGKIQGNFAIQALMEPFVFL
jgi:hypothetical protein